MGFGANSSKQSNQSQQTSEARNQAYPFLQGALGSQVSNVNTGTSSLSNILGLNGAQGQDAAFQRFRDSSGYNFVRDQGMEGINSNNAAKGLLSSGSALKSLTTFNNGLANNYLDKYLSQLNGLTSTGLNAAQILAGAGSTSNSQGTSSGTGKSSGFNFTSG